MTLDYFDNDMNVAQYVVIMQAELVVYSVTVEVLHKKTWYYVEYAIKELQTRNPIYTFITSAC